MRKQFFLKSLVVVLSLAVIPAVLSIKQDMATHKPAASKAFAKALPITVTPVKSEAPAVTKARVQEALGNLPLYFIENRGQLDARVIYYVQGSDMTVYFTSGGMTFALTGKGDRPVGPDTPGHQASLLPVAFGTAPPHEGARQRWAIRLDFIGANPGVKPTAQDPTPAVISYFKGGREQWKTGLKTYATVVYANLWPGIDLVYSGTVNLLKYTFLVKPGADPQQIKFAYRGATAVRLTEAGELVVSTPVGGFHDEQPYAYQEIEGQRVEVAAAYAVASKNPAGLPGYAFRLGPYDKGKPLVIDPAMLVYAGYIGGSARDQGFGIAVDASGNAYVGGQTASDEATFPVMVGPDLTFHGDRDAFVAKVNADGTGLVYAGFLGGSRDDAGLGIAVDTLGNAYLTGVTNSTEATFPVMVGPDLTFHGDFDAFVAKVKADGTGLIYAGYIGGSGLDVGRGIAVDTLGNAYVTGDTSSTEATFPETVGPDLTFNGVEDAFVAKVKAAGTGLDYAGYIGGSGGDDGNGIAVDSLGNAYVGGQTASDEATFPVMVGPDLTYNGSTDAFVAKVNAAGTGLDYAGYIGGAGLDFDRAIAVDTLGNAYLTGDTSSTEATFPVAVGPDLTYNGSTDAFVAKVKAAGTGLDYAGYIGGSGPDEGFGIAVDTVGNAYIAGITASDETTFPVTGGPDLTFNGGFGDAFVAKVNAAGTGLDYAGYIGGAGGDVSYDIAVDTVGNAYIAGITASDETTFPVTGGPDLTANGDFDAFVAKIAEVPAEGCPPNDDDDDNDGLLDANELLFGTLLGNSDSDGDGIKDGNDDANGNGQDDEDEDDDAACPDRDSDGDGTDDEDEDD